MLCGFAFAANAAADPVVGVPSVPSRVKLKAFGKFENTAEALGAATAIADGKLSKGEGPARPPAQGGLCAKG